MRFVITTCYIIISEAVSETCFNINACLEHSLKSSRKTLHKTLCKKWSFPLRISSVNMTKFAVSCGFGHIYWTNPQWKTSFFVQWKNPHSEIFWSTFFRIWNGFWDSKSKCKIMQIRKIPITDILHRESSFCIVKFGYFIR